MINDISTLFFVASFILVFAIISSFAIFFLTKKYNDKYHNLYSLFMDISKKNIILESIVLLNFLVVFYFIFNIDNFSSIAFYLIIVINIISCFISFNFHIIISNIIYSGISVVLLWLLNLLNNYSKFILYDEKIMLVKILFIIMVIIFTLLVVVRQTEILIRTERRET